MIFDREIEFIRAKGLWRRVIDRNAPSGSVSPLTGSRIILDGTELLNFSSNDYLGLAASPDLAEAAKNAIDRFGFGAGASRLLGGGTSLHRGLEQAVASFKGTEDALIFASGYQANVSAIASLAREGDVIISDELNHASIVDGCRLSRAKKIIFRHGDVTHLRDLMKAEEGRRRIVISDTVFSMDGDIAPLQELYELCGSSADTLLYLDEAHATGVLGNGRGALAHCGLKPQPWLIQMGTFSKALGSFGAFIAATREVVEWLTNTARGLIFSTALPPCVAAASIKALEIAGQDAGRRERLWRNQARAVEGLRRAGFRLVSDQTPILAVIVGDIDETLAFAAKLRDQGIYAPAIRPPTVPAPRIRVTVSAAHTDEDVDSLVRAFGSQAPKA